MISMKKALKQKAQQGNVLFLILIAVALFAALSYAVTQSSRGGSDASKETDLINSAQITQYPTQVRTAVLRMMIQGVSSTQLLFNKPAHLDDISDTPTYGVFHPSGGEAVYQDAPAIFMDPDGPNATGEWFFNGNFSIGDIGTSDTEVIAFLPGITEAVCNKLNSELEVASTASAETTASDVIGDSSSADNIINITRGTEGAEATSDSYNYDADDDAVSFPAEWDGYAFGCIENATDGFFTYFYVLVER